MTKPLDPRKFFEIYKNTDAKSFARTLIPHSTPLQSNETAVVALYCPRTAALCFDRVWSILEDATFCPDGIKFNASTDAELVAALFCYVATHSKDYLKKYTDADLDAISSAIIDDDMETILGRKDFAAAYLISQLGISLAGGFQSMLSNPLNGMSRVISESLQKTMGRNVIPIYTSESIRDEEYMTGEHQVVVGSLRELEIVDEKCLSWEQVLEFRQDSAAKTDYRKLIHWLDGQMVGKSNQYIIDEIGNRLDKYKAALRKHGLQTKIGILASMIDLKTLISSIAVAGGALIAGKPLFGGLVSAGVLLGKVLISIVEAKIDLENVHEQHEEIAFVAQINERLKK